LGRSIAALKISRPGKNENEANTRTKAIIIRESRLKMVFNKRSNNVNTQVCHGRASLITPRSDLKI